MRPLASTKTDDESDDTRLWLKAIDTKISITPFRYFPIDNVKITENDPDIRLRYRAYSDERVYPDGNSGSGSWNFDEAEIVPESEVPGR